MRKLLRTKVVGQAAIYHAMSRIVGGELLLGDSEKEVLRKMLWQVSDFCGVEVLTYCIMDNHFHVLVRVPEQDIEVTDAELLRRFKVLYPKPSIRPWSFAGWKRPCGRGMRMRSKFASAFYRVCMIFQSL